MSPYTRATLQSLLPTSIFLFYATCGFLTYGYNKAHGDSVTWASLKGMAWPVTMIGGGIFFIAEKSEMIFTTPRLER